MSLITFLIFLLLPTVELSGEVQRQKSDGSTILVDVVRSDTALLTPKTDVKLLDRVDPGDIVSLECVTIPTIQPLCRVN